MTGRAASRPSRRPLWLRRGRCEAVTIALIGLGVVMLMQPLSVHLYSYSFITILAGTLGFVIVSHFPD
jgi:CO dehydrogenase/acetyl-CoA synthase delta subunit